MQKFEEKILSGEFDAAKVVTERMNKDELMQEILYLACKTRNVSIYGFVVNELLNAEKVEWHYIAAEMLLAPLSIIDGAYALGVYHARKAIQLEPENLEHKKLLLAFYSTPEPVISREEAINLSKEIIVFEPNNESALEILQDDNRK
ncbi:MAG: hypothetical protein AB7F19_04635 [Candidatus Babeliales bacterium]